MAHGGARANSGPKPGFKRRITRAIEVKKIEAEAQASSSGVQVSPRFEMKMTAVVHDATHPVTFALAVMADEEQDIYVRLAACKIAAHHACPVPLATRGEKEAYNASDWAAVVERLIMAKFPRETWPQQAVLEYERNPQKYGSAT